MFAGCLAQVTAGVVFTPVDIIKERHKVCWEVASPSTAHKFSNVRSVVLGVFEQHGLKGLLRGYWLQNAVWVPWSALHVGLLERYKTRVRAYQEGELETWQVSVGSMGAAGTAAVLTHPLDVAKTRY